MTECIVCGRSGVPETVEHIIPRALGNLHYVLPRGAVCSRCNHRFGHVENRVLSSPEFVEERRRLGILRDPGQLPTSELSASDLQLFVAKMIYEGLYKSKRKEFVALPHGVRQLLTGQSHKTDRVETADSASYQNVPGLIDNFRLRNNHLSLQYRNTGNELYGRFCFGKIAVGVRVV